jgi:hypothetical protein
LEWKSAYWIHLAQDREKCQTAVSTIVFGFNKMRGISGLAEELLASQEGLCSLDIAG